MPVVRVGPCENQVFYATYIASSPLTKDLVFRNLGLAPFTENWATTNRLPTMIYITTCGRAILDGIPTDQTSLVYAVTMAEMIAPYLDDAIFLDQAASREKLIAAVRAVLGNPMMMRNFPQVTQARWELLFGEPVVAQQGAGRPAAVPVQPAVDRQIDAIFTPEVTNPLGNPTRGDWNINDAQQAIRILYYLASVCSPFFVVDPLSIIATLTVAVSKRGTVTNDFIEKIMDGIQTDLNKQVILSSESINMFYSNFSSGINDVTIVDVRERWTLLIPHDAVRLRLIVTQLVGSGLTSYMTIIRAFKLYGDFKWPTIQRAFPAEWQNFKSAMNVVGGNLYYGFRRDLGPAKSTNYKNISWVAKELLVRGNGETALNRYRGWPRSIPNRNAISEMIETYLRERAVLNLGEADQQFATQDDNLVIAAGGQDFNDIAA